MIVIHNVNKNFPKTDCSFEWTNIVRHSFHMNNAMFYVDIHDYDKAKLLVSKELYTFYAAYEDCPQEMLSVIVRFVPCVDNRMIGVVLYKNDGKIVDNCDNENDIVLFDSETAYLNWLKTKIYKDMENNNVRSEFENYAKAVSEVFNDFLNDHKGSSALDTLIDFFDSYVKEQTGSDCTEKPQSESSKMPQSKGEKKTECSCTEKKSDLFDNVKVSKCSCDSCRFNFGFNDKMVIVSKSNGKFYIDGAEVSEEAFNNAIEVIETGGSIEKIINSIIDIKTEYDRLQKASKDNVRINEIEKAMAALQAELDSLKK